MKRPSRCRLSPMLRKYKFFFDLLKKTTDAYLFCTDVKTKTTMLSPNVVQDFEMPSEVVENLGEMWSLLIHPDERNHYIASLRAVTEKHTMYEHSMEYRIKTRKGEYIWIRTRGHVGFDRDGEPTVFIGMATRMAGRNQADEVTGLLNKYQFEHSLRVVLRASRITDEGGAVMLFGLDNFKIVNETYNRIIGDELLKFVSRRIEAILPPALNLYKLDGDVFAVIYPSASEEDTSELFSAIQRSLARPIEIEGHQCFCTMSAGTVFYPQSGKDYLVLQKHAEAAMDIAKRGGKNRNCVFSKEEYNRWVRSISLRDSLRESVEANCNGFELYFQPQVDAVTKKLIGAEALLRWFNMKGRGYSPMEFIPILEETKLILPVGKWIFEEAVRICRRWRRIMPDFKVSINMSYEQVKDGSFREFVFECMDRYRIAPGSVVLELTESKIVADWHFVNREFNEFRKLGIEIAMDDFGTGYSSLSTLKNLSCDIVKIDREFVRNIETSEFDMQLVEYAVNLCHSVGMKTCIEGVEKESAYRLLTEKCNADYIQGYLFGRPESAENFEKKFLSAAG